MKIRKIDIFFFLSYIALASLTIIAACYLWPVEKRFDTFWYSTIFVVFLELVLFIKPIIAGYIPKGSGGIFIAFISLNLLFVLVSLVLLVVVNLATRMTGPWVTIATLTWLVVYTAIVGIFFNVSVSDHQENTAAIQAEQSLQRVKIQSYQTLSNIKNLLSEKQKNELVNEILIIEKMIANLAGDRSNQVGDIDGEIVQQLNDIEGCVISGDFNEVALLLSSIKTALRNRALLLRK